MCDNKVCEQADKLYRAAVIQRDADIAEGLTHGVVVSESAVAKFNKLITLYDGLDAPVFDATTESQPISKNTGRFRLAEVLRSVAGKLRNEALEAIDA